MGSLKIIVLVLLIGNAVLPFILRGGLNKYSNALGWCLAGYYLYILP